MNKKVLLMNSVGKDDTGKFIIHSPSRWSEGVKELSSWFAYYPWELAYRRDSKKCFRTEA